MPRYTEHYDLEEEAEQIDDRLDSLADERVSLREELSEGTMAAKHEKERLSQEASRLEQMLAGVQWALDPDDGRDPIKEVTIASLQASEYAKAADEYEKALSSGNPNDTKRNARKVFFAATYIEEAPFIEPEMSDKKRIAAVRKCAPQFVHWIDQRGDELTTPSVEGNGYRQRVAEKM